MKLLSKKNKDRIFIIAMLIIPIAHFLVFWLYLNGASIGLAFKDQYTEEFTMENFQRFVNSWERDFKLNGPLKYAIKNTIIEACIANFVNMPLVIFCSFALFKKFYGHTFFRIVFYLPGILGTMIMTTMQIYVLGSGGPIVQFGNLIGIKWDVNILQSGLLGNNISARPTYFITRLGVAGGTILLITGALNRVPKDLFDSAKIDGIGFFREFYYIALPLIWSTVGLMWIMSFAGCWSSYQGVMLLTGGAHNTTNFGYYLVSHTLSAVTGTGENYNYPAAIGVIMTVIIAPITLLLRWVASKAVSDVEF